MASAARIMDKPRQEQPPSAALKCPRCDSSNTKFCYYNNYSLSQPRHFCKACKRYWTRGGTLRNVPVGGGCRKNKRLKTSTSSGNSSGKGASLSPATQNPRPQNGTSLSQISPIFYGVHNTTPTTTNPSDLNLQFSSLESVSGLNFPPQLDGVSLGFSSGFLFQPAISFEQNLQVLGNSGAHLIPLKEEKIDSMGRFCQNQAEQIDLSLSDPSHYWNPTPATVNWHDPTNTGSSITSLF